MTKESRSKPSCCRLCNLSAVPLLGDTQGYKQSMVVDTLEYHLVRLWPWGLGLFYKCEWPLERIGHPVNNLGTIHARSLFSISVLISPQNDKGKKSVITLYWECPNISHGFL